MSDLFSSAGLDQNAPRPLADRMRPTKLSEVVGQDHLVGPDGILTRLIASKTLGSLVFWGPPGTAAPWEPARCSSSTISTASTGPSSTPSCPSWRTVLFLMRPRPPRTRP